jgi:argininosuccinate lyase
LSRGLYRWRLKAALDEEAARFHTSIYEDLRIFEEDIDGTEAHDIMLHEVGIIPLEALRAILRALEELRKEWRESKVEVSPEYEDIHEYVESKVIEKIGEVGGMMHTGRSRNDQVIVDIKMKVRGDLLEVAEALLDLLEAMLRRAEEHAKTVMILYTHAQHAQVGTLAHYLLAYIDTLLRDLDRILECYRRVNLNPLGGGPIGGTSIPIDRKRTTELLGFDAVVENSIDATSGRDWAIEVAAVSAILMSSLSRMASDLILWSTKEFGYIELSDEYSTSSSIMPQKKNPSTLELVRGRTSEVYATLTELLSMVKGVSTGYSQDLQGTKPPLWRCLDVVKGSLRILRGAISTMAVKAERMRKVAEESYTYAVDLAEALVVEAGLPFREAYQLVAHVVGKLGARSLKELTTEELKEASREALGKSIKVRKSLIEEVTDPYRSLERRTSMGCPRPSEVKRMLAERWRTLKGMRGRVEGLIARVEEAKRRLRETVESYISAEG